MKKVAIIGLLASVQYEVIQGVTILGNVANGGDAEHIHNIGYKCPVRIQLDNCKIKKNSVIQFVPSQDAIQYNVNVQFLPMSKADRKSCNVEAVVTVTGAITLATGSKLNVIPNKFNLGSVVII